MTSFLGIDREGRQWALLAVNGDSRARLVSGEHHPAVLATTELVNAHGPLVLVPNHCGMSQLGRNAFLDVVDLVATDPETATVDQIAAVATWARSLLRAGTEQAL